MNERYPVHAVDVGQAEVSSDVPIRQLCTFFLDGKQFGLDILDVQEVSVVPTFTKVYHAPVHVAGVVNIRGQIMLCLDVRVLFGMSPAELTPESRLILFKPTVGEDFGILVDQVDDIIEVSEDLVEKRIDKPAGSRDKEQSLQTSVFVKEICKLDGRLLLVLNSAAILTELDAVFNALHAEG